MMKKIIAILAVLLLCASFTVSAFATPSVTNPLAPEVVFITDENGDPAAGVMIGANGEILDYVYYNPCLVVTPVADAETSEHIPDDAEQLLLQVYAQLQSGQMQLPYEMFDADLLPENMVIRDLFDVTFICEEHPQLLASGEAHFQVTFRLDVEADKDVYVMVYSDGQWNPTVSTVNNGDGTVTCGFNSVGPVVFCVEEQSEDDDQGGSDTPVTPPEKTGDPMGEQLMVWVALAAFCVVGVTVLTVVYMRDRKRED